MEDELEKFIRESKARVAQDKACLEQEPPYMEIMAKPSRTRGSSVKENIPPRTANQAKEESCSAGLPLGAEYEKKKHRLQNELRMDYRRYMAQQLQLETDVPKQRLTWDRGLLRAPQLADQNQEPVSELYMDPDRVESPLDLDSGEEEAFKDQLEKTGGRKPRLPRSEAGYQKSLWARSDEREKEEQTSEVWSDGRRSRDIWKNDKAHFGTGLVIGAADSAEALRRKKERYRKELQEQIAEQHRNRKREKDLEMKVAATGANDPEKPPERIRQFGLSRREAPLSTEPLATAESGSSSRTTASNQRAAVRGRERPLPDLPHVAFQSPLLEYSSALGMGDGRLSPNGRHVAPSVQNAVDIHRTSAFLPHPPPPMRDAYRSLYGEPHQCCGTRNLLDTNMAYYHRGPDAGFPVSYWNIPPGGAVSSQLGSHSPHSQHGGYSYPEALLGPSNQSTAAGSQAGGFPSERAGSTRDRILSYREALKLQIQEQQERRRREREEREHLEAQLEAEMKDHDPWGRGGGGAPLRDSRGNLIADLNQMHKLNEEAYSNPELWQRRATAAAATRRTEPPPPTERPPESSSYDTADRLPGFTHVQSTQFARGKVFSTQPSERQLQEQDKYKAYLKQQIEEKMRKKAEERERIRLEEEKEERRLAEQRARIQREYEEEQERKRRKEMEQKAKNQELIQLAEQRRKEAERKKKEAEEKESAAVRRQDEREMQARVQEVCREPSPPIPTLQRKNRRPRQHTPSPPSAALSERSSSGLQSPPVPARRNQLRAAGDRHDLFSELSALRQQLRSEQKRLESDLQNGSWEELDSPVNVREREHPVVDVFDMARLRLQAPVRRPNSRTTEPRNPLQIHESLQLKPTGEEFWTGSGPDRKPEEVRGRSREQHQLSSHRSTVQDDYLDLSPLEQNHYLRSVSGASRRAFLLESESAFMNPLGEASPVPPTPDPQRIRQPSARERRRLAKQVQRPQEPAASCQSVGPQRSRPDLSRIGLNLEEAGSGLRNRSRTGRLMGLSRQGPPDESDEDSSPPRLSPLSLTHESSEETVATDSWMGSGSSEPLKHLDRASRRNRLTS